MFPSLQVLPLNPKQTRPVWWGWQGARVSRPLLWKVAAWKTPWFEVYIDPWLVLVGGFNHLEKWWSSSMGFGWHHIYIYIIYTHRIHGAGIYANLWGIFMGSMLPYIAAPWIRHGIYEMENHIKMFETTKQCTLESTFKDRASWINQPPPPQCFLVI